MTIPYDGAVLKAAKTYFLKKEKKISVRTLTMHDQGMAKFLRIWCAKLYNHQKVPCFARVGAEGVHHNK